MILYLLIIILTIILGGLSIYLSKLFFGSKYYLFSPVVVVLAYYFLRTYPGTIDASVVLDTYRPILGALFSLIGIICALTTVILLPKKINSYQNNHMTISQPKIIYAFILLGVLAVIFTFVMFGRVPFFYLFQDLFGGGAETSMHAARRMNTLEHRSGDTVYFGQGYLKVIYLTISPIFISILYTLKRIKRESLKIPKLLMLAFCIFASLNGQIWPVINLILIFSITVFAFPYIFSSLNSSRKSPIDLFKKGLRLMAAIIIFIFIYRYAQQLSGREFDNFFLDTFRRIYADDQALLYKLFPEQFDFRHGSTWVNDLLGFLPGSSQNFSYEVHYLVHGGGWGFTLSPGLFVSSYVNFGFLGNFSLFYFIVLFYSIIYKCLMNTPSVESKILAIYLSFSLAISLAADIASVILPFFIIIFISLAVYMSHLLLKSKKVVLELNEIPHHR